MTATSALRARAGLLAISAGALLWGTTGVAVRIIGDRSGLGPVPIGCYRLLIAALVCGLAFGRRGFGEFGRMWASHRWRLIGAGVGLGGYQALYFIGVADVGVSVATLVSLGIAPVVLTVTAAVRTRRRPASAATVTVVAALAGLATICVSSGGAGGDGPHPVIGILASVGSGLGYAATTELNRRLAVGGQPLLLTAASSAIGGLVLLPIALPIGMALPHDGVSLFWLGYIGVVPTVLAYWLFYSGLRSVTADAAGVLTLLEPLAATVLAAVALGETLPVAGWCGAALLLAAIAGLYARAPAAEPAPL
jgi:DME family drug/metabolite transporter